MDEQVHVVEHDGVDVLEQMVEVHRELLGGPSGGEKLAKYRLAEENS